MNPIAFREDLTRLLNQHCAENGCDTPDWVLAEYLIGCLATFDAAVKAREEWYGREPKNLCSLKSL